MLNFQVSLSPFPFFFSTADYSFGLQIRRSVPMPAILVNECVVVPTEFENVLPFV